MTYGLTEADARIQNYFIGRDTQLSSRSNSLHRPFFKLGENVGAGRQKLHVARPASHVHEDKRGAETGCERTNPRAFVERCDVVYYRCAALQRRLRHLFFGSINRHRKRIAAAKSLQYGDDSAHFLFRCHPLRPWPCGFTSKLEDVRTFVGNLPGTLDCIRQLEIAASVGKGVRSNVQHAQDQRARTEFKNTVP